MSYLEGISNRAGTKINVLYDVDLPNLDQVFENSEFVVAPGGEKGRAPPSCTIPSGVMMSEGGNPKVAIVGLGVEGYVLALSWLASKADAG